jgi:hypothetical protein
MPGLTSWFDGHAGIVTKARIHLRFAFSAHLTKGSSSAGQRWVIFPVDKTA